MAAQMRGLTIDGRPSEQNDCHLHRDDQSTEQQYITLHTGEHVPAGGEQRRSAQLVIFVNHQTPDIRQHNERAA